MVAAVRQHQSIRTVARHFGVSTSTVTYWVQRAKGQRLDRVDWADHSRAPHHTQRTADELEERVAPVLVLLAAAAETGALREHFFRDIGAILRRVTTLIRKKRYFSSILIQ